MTLFLVFIKYFRARIIQFAKITLMPIVRYYRLMTSVHVLVINLNKK